MLKEAFVNREFLSWYKLCVMQICSVHVVAWTFAPNCVASAPRKWQIIPNLQQRYWRQNWWPYIRRQMSDKNWRPMFHKLLIKSRIGDAKLPLCRRRQWSSLAAKVTYPTFRRLSIVLKILWNQQPEFKPDQEHKKYLWEFFQVKNVVLTCCWCANPQCVFKDCFRLLGFCLFETITDCFRFFVWDNYHARLFITHGGWAHQHRVSTVIWLGKTLSLSCVPDGVRTLVTTLIESRVRRCTNWIIPCGKCLSWNTFSSLKVML